LVVGAYLAPALWDGFSFGPTDIANQLSFLTYTPHLAVHNGLNGDIITQEVPWNALDWLAVHHGQLPLWNSYSGDGMPLLLNFESSPFALGALVGYLFPLGASYLVSFAVTLLVAGTGTYVAARLAGVGPLGAALAGTTFMLSGSFSGWAGWAVGGPLAWAGWLLAGILLCCRPGRRRWVGVVVVAVSSGFAVYEGFPESVLFVGIAIGTIVVAGGGLAALKGNAGVAGPACLVAGAAGGAALSAPLWLPGYAILTQSSRATENGTGGLPVHALALLFAQGYDGLPTAGASWFGPADYYEATAYVGVIAIVLALVAVLVAWRRPLVAALGVSAFVSVGIVYVPATQRLFTRLGAGSVATQRMLPMLAFALAMLAGVGAEILERRWRRPEVRLKACAGAIVCAVVLGYLFVTAPARGLSPAELSVRRHSLFWPVLTLAGMAVVLALAARARRHPATERRGPVGPAGAALLVLLAAQSAYLVWAGIGVNSYASTPFPLSAQVAKLQRLVGHNLVALDGVNKHDVTLWTGVGIYPEVNIGYGIRELAVHDPVIPPAYFLTWPDQDATVSARLGNNVFAPAVGSATRARYYGASYILAAPGSVPKGAELLARFKVPLAGSLYLYRVPGATQFTFGANTEAKVVSARQTGNASWRLAVDVPTASALTLHLTYFPGWHVSADGRALPVQETGGLFVGATVPAGTRIVTVTYWPGELTAGFALALAVIAGMLVGSVLVVRPMGGRRGSCSD
jgi:Bacterial membrane protein YfhO